MSKIGYIIILRLGLSLAMNTYLVPLMNIVDTPPDCNGICSGKWSTWNNWSDCHGGECHVIPGKQTRRRSCYSLFVPPQSRGDFPEDTKPEWKMKCRQEEERPCADESTCTGSWGEWGAWTPCVRTRRTNATCHKNRHRVCNDGIDRDTRINSDDCYGGMHEDTDGVTCDQDVCEFVQVTSTIATLTVPDKDATGIQAKSSGIVKSEAVSNGEPPAGPPSANTMIILAVSLGSVVFGIVFIVLLINLIRQSSNSRQDRHPIRRDHWKRMTSTTTSSYVAASEVAEVRSPSSMTVTSGESSSSSSNTNQCPFNRNDSVFIYTAADSNGATFNSFASKPRRNRYIQDNVYWEISDQTQDHNYSEVTTTAPEQAREEIDNVLYDVDA